MRGQVRLGDHELALEHALAQEPDQPQLDRLAPLGFHLDALAQPRVQDPHDRVEVSDRRHHPGTQVLLQQRPRIVPRPVDERLEAEATALDEILRRAEQPRPLRLEQVQATDVVPRHRPETDDLVPADEFRRLPSETQVVAAIHARQVGEDGDVGLGDQVESPGARVQVPRLLAETEPIGTHGHDDERRARHQGGAEQAPARVERSVRGRHARPGPPGPAAKGRLGPAAEPQREAGEPGDQQAGAAREEQVGGRRRRGGRRPGQQGHREAAGDSPRPARPPARHGNRRRQFGGLSPQQPDGRDRRQPANRAPDREEHDEQRTRPAQRQGQRLDMQVQVARTHGRAPKRAERGHHRAGVEHRSAQAEQDARTAEQRAFQQEAPPHPPDAVAEGQQEAHLAGAALRSQTEEQAHQQRRGDDQEQAETDEQASEIRGAGSAAQARRLDRLDRQAGRVKRDAGRRLRFEVHPEPSRIAPFRRQQPQRGQEAEAAGPELGAVVQVDEELRCAAVLVPVRLVPVPDKAEIDRKGRVPVAHVVGVGDAGKVRRQVPVRCPARHLDHARHGGLNRPLDQLFAVADDEVVDRQPVALSDLEVFRQERVDQHLARPERGRRSAVGEPQHAEFPGSPGVERGDRRVRRRRAVFRRGAVGEVGRDAQRLDARGRRQDLYRRGEFLAEHDLRRGDPQVVLRLDELEAEVLRPGLGADPSLEVQGRGLGSGLGAVFRSGALPHEQRVRQPATVQLPLQVAQPRVADQWLALVRRQPEAPHASVVEHRDDAQPHALQLVLRVLLPHQAGPRRLARSLQIEHDRISRLDGERLGQRTIDRQRREELALAPGQVERLLAAREEGGELVVDPLYVDPGGAPAALGFDHAALHQDPGRHRSVAAGELLVAGQFVAQRLAEEAGAEQRVVDSAQPVEGELAQASPHRIANHQRAGQHGGRDRRGQHHGDIRPPVVTKTRQGSARTRGAHRLSLRPPARTGNPGSARPAAPPGAAPSPPAPDCG